MKFDRYSIRRMRREEMDLAVDWAAMEGWNPGLYDADCFYNTDPNGFFVGLLDDEPIGCISAVAYGESFGFLGFYIVKPEYRGNSFGLQLWDEGMKYLRGRNVGLDGVIDQQTNYKKSGFKLSYRNIRYQGLARPQRDTSSNIAELSKIPFDDLAAYDDQFFPQQRHKFLKYWTNQPEGAALGITDSGRLSGYGVLRKCREGFKIGPLFADDVNLAEEIFLALSSRASKAAPFFLDIPEVNSAALALAKRHNMEKVFETARMYNKEVPTLFMDRLFGVTTFELG